MMEVNTIFMYDGKEYKIVSNDIKKSRINLQPIVDNITMPEINEKIIIENIIFKVIYVNGGKHRITIEPIKKGV